MSLLALAAQVLDPVRKGGRQGCLVGGLAVSVGADPQFTRDVDLVVAVDGERLAGGVSLGVRARGNRRFLRWNGPLRNLVGGSAHGGGYPASDPAGNLR